jgi:hypothetical protein
MSLHEIVLPETKPYAEWILGRAVRKVSGVRTHARLQGALGAALLPWADAHGEVGIEWQFRVAPPGEVRRLSPDDIPQHVAHKISVYLASGSELVIVVDPHDRSVHLHDRDGARVLHGEDVLRHNALPGFALALPALFRAIDPPR